MYFSILKNVLTITKKPIKIWKRSLLINYNYLGFVFSVHNGKNFVNLIITPKMLTKHFGEFSLTRKYPKHFVKDKRVKKKKKK